MTTNWQQEFENTFILNPEMSKSIKDFITTLLEKQREEYYNLVLKALPSYTYTGDPQIDDACEMVQDEYKRTLIANIKTLIKSHDNI